MGRSPATEGNHPRPVAVEVDGRVLRGERNREAIFRALLELIREGHPQPTAREVAERAGVQARTVFRHFQDMAGLNAELSARVGAELRPLFEEATRQGSVEDRIQMLARVRGRAYERLAPFERANRAHRQRFEFIRADHEAMVLELRKNLRDVLPELRNLPPHVHAMLELAFSFEAWDRLRSDQQLSVAQAQRAVTSGALALLRDAGTLEPRERERAKRRRPS